MRRFVEEADRGQWTLLPECLDDFIDESNPVRVIDVFVEALDLAEMSFEGVEPAATGRPSYHPSVLLKLYIYGYLNRVQSSRRLEREAGRNVEVMWLLRGFAPNRRAAPDFAPNLERLKSTRDAAGPLGLTLVPAEARGLDALEQASMIGERAQAPTVLSDGGAAQLSSRSGRRSDRIEPLFAAVHVSAVGTFRT